MIGDISAVNLTLTEVEGSIAQALTQGYVRNPTVAVKAGGGRWSGSPLVRGVN